MKIDSITNRNTLPQGRIRVAAIANRHMGKKRMAELNDIPNGRARTRSFYSGEHTVILAEDAIRLGWPVVAFGTVSCETPTYSKP